MKSLVRWQPFQELTSLQRQMNHLFDTFFGRTPGMPFEGNLSTEEFGPPADVYEDDQKLTFKVEVAVRMFLRFFCSRHQTIRAKSSARTGLFRRGTHYQAWAVHPTPNTILGTDLSEEFRINDRGDLVGAYVHDAGFSHDFLLSNTGNVTTIDLPGADDTYAARDFSISSRV